jgi:hypothetical protein
MPFSGFKDFDTCVLAQKKEGKSDEEAKKICGTLQAKEEGNKAVKGGSLGEFENKFLKHSDLFLKYKLIDDSYGLSGFRLTNLDTKLNDIIGKPFPRQVANPLETRMKDGHLWSMIPNAGYEDHLREAWNNAEGVVVDLSSELDRNDQSVKGGSNRNTASKYVTIKILDPVRKQYYLDNPKNVPKAVSIGVFDDDYGANGNVIQNYRPVHVMPVDNPAWKDATHIGSCKGEEQVCTAALRGASASDSASASWDIPKEHLKQAQQLTLQGGRELTSLDTSNQNKTNIMSANQTADSANTGQTIVANPTTTTTTTPATGSVLRLRTATANSKQNTGAPIAAPQQPQVAEQAPVVNEDNQANTNPNPSPSINEDPDLQTLNMRLAAVEKEALTEKRKNMIRSKIPREAFVVKDKFNNEAFEKEVEKMAKKENWTDADFDTYYTAQKRLIQYELAKQAGFSGYYTPEGPNPLAGNPLLGGSDADEALKGGSAVSSQKIEALRNCIRMIGVEI